MIAYSIATQGEFCRPKQHTAGALGAQSTWDNARPSEPPPSVALPVPGTPTVDSPSIAMRSVRSQNLPVAKGVGQHQARRKLSDRFDRQVAIYCS